MSYWKFNKNSIINIYWYLMKFYFFMKARYRVIYTYIIKILYTYRFIDPYIRNTRVIRDSKILYNCNHLDLEHISYYDYDYIVYNYDDNYCDNKENKTNFAIVLNQLDNIKKLEQYSSSDRKSNISFILVKLKLFDKDDTNDIDVETHDITHFLKNANINYYVNDGNLFTENFMNWIFISYLKKTPKNYKINILDNNINEITITNKEYIILNKDSYKIFNL